MSEKLAGDGKGSSDWTQKSLEWLRNLRIFLAIKKTDKEIDDLGKSEAVLRNGPRDSSEMANIRLKANRDLEAMKPNLDEKTYDLAEKYTLFGLVLKESGVTDENLGQAALEFIRSHPTKAKYSDGELAQQVQHAAEQAKNRQKAIDDEVLTNRLAEERTIEKKIEVVNEFRAAGLVFGGKDLEEMGFLKWLAQGSPPSPSSPPPYADQTPPKRPSTRYTDSEIKIAFDRNFGSAAAGGYITTTVIMDGCSEFVKIDVQMPSKTKLKCSFKTIPCGTPLVKGDLTVYVPASVPLGDHELTIKASDPSGKTGITSYFLTVTR